MSEGPFFSGRQKVKVTWALHVPGQPSSCCQYSLRTSLNRWIDFEIISHGFPLRLLNQNY